MCSLQQRYLLCLLIFFTVFCVKTEQFTISPKQELNSDKSMVSFVPHTNFTRNTTKLHNFQQSKSTQNPLQLTNSEARGSTYSYYYISRRVWYIPLWFLIYFCFYIMGLIIRSIILHKVCCTSFLAKQRFYTQIHSRSEQLQRNSQADNSCIHQTRLTRRWSTI